MAFSDIMDNALSTITGNVAKATIRIKDKRSRKNAALNESDMPKVSGGGFSVSDVASNAASKALSMASDIVPGLGALAGGYNASMTVQFNPSSIQVRSVGGDDDMQITNYTTTGAAVSKGGVGLHVEFSVKLIFDRISNTGAFAQDMLTMSSTRAISTVGGAISGLFSGAEQSVQVTVEAFIAAMRDENTRSICFEWGEFMYEGVLSRVNSTYTMFDISGNPIRAEVELVIYMVDEKIEGADYSEYWEDAYYEAFISGNPTAMAAYEMAKVGLL